MCHLLGFPVGATSNQRQMRLWHLSGRDQEVAPTEERSLQQTINVESLNEIIFIRIGII